MGSGRFRMNSHEAGFVCFPSRPYNAVIQKLFRLEAGWERIDQGHVGCGMKRTLLREAAMKTTRFAVISLLALLTPGLVLAATFRSDDDIYAPGTWTADEVIGREVNSDQQPKIATVHDVLVGEGRAKQLILSLSPVTGGVPRYVAISIDGAERLYTADMLSAVKISGTKPLSDFPVFSYRGDGERKGSIPQGWLSAREILDKQIVDRQSTAIASLEDIVFRQNNQALAALLSVGGFLAIGDKSVAVSFSDLDVGQNGQLTLNVRREQLDAAPNVGLKIKKSG
jgi:hypothetical protein